MSKYVHDHRPRLDEHTNARLKRLAAAYGMKPNVLIRELIESSISMIGFVQRHPEPLGPFDWNEVTPEAALWLASASRQSMKDKAADMADEAAARPGESL